MALALGFADPVFDAQRVFRAVMDAMARPGSVQPLAGIAGAPLPPGLAAVALALADADTALWLDPPLATAEVMEFLRFHTGAPVVADPAAASLALVADPASCPALDRFAAGTAEYPDRSATVVLAVDGLAGGLELVLAGPGIDGVATIAPHPVPADFADRLRRNRASFPLGVDHLLVAPGGVAALPRSTKVT